MRKKCWVVEIYDPERDVMVYVGEPQTEADAMDDLIKFDREFPDFSVSSRKLAAEVTA